MKNKRGFIAVSIIFSFFIVFLLLLTINLTAYAQNRILLNQVKKDTKNSLNLEATIQAEKIDIDDSSIAVGATVTYKPVASYNNDTFATNFSNGSYTKYSVYSGVLDPTELKYWKIIKTDNDYIYAISLYCSSATIKIIGQSTYNSFVNEQFSTILNSIYGDGNSNVTFRHYYEKKDKNYLPDDLKQCYTPKGSPASYFTSANIGEGTCSSEDSSVCYLYGISNSDTRYQPPTVAKRSKSFDRELNPDVTSNKIDGATGSFRPVAIIKKGTNSFYNIGSDSTTIYLK